MPRFERRVLHGGVLVAAPGLAAAIALAVFAPDRPLAWLAVAIAALASLWLVRRQFRRVAHPFYTLAGLIEALRSGDYSLRGARQSVLGDLVTDLNRLAERLQRERFEHEESSYLLGKTLAALDSAVFVFDEGQRLRLMNPAAAALLDAKSQLLFGRGAVELGLATLLEGPERALVAHAFPGRSGRFEIRHVPLRSGGRGGRLLVVNDLGRVLRDEERAAWQRLLRVLGHEVNNSLAPIRSMAGTLATLAAREPLPDDWREDFASGLHLIEHRADALGRFLASYSRLARLPPPKPRSIELAALLRRLVALETRLAVDFDGDQEIRLEADPDQLEQALINLLGNAVEASLPHGAVQVRCRTEGGNAVIAIDDEGPGPPPSENLFVPFFTTKQGGSGIGLVLARQIAEAHGGGVSLNPREGAPGASATLWLPMP